MSHITLRSFRSRRRRAFAAFAVLPSLVLAAAPCAAQESGRPEKLTLSELAGLALKNSPLLDSRDARVEESRLSADQARVWSGPSADVLFGRRTDGGDSGPRFGWSLSQPLPLTRKPILRGRLSDLGTEAARARRAAAEVAVTLAVARGAYEYVAAGRKAAYAERRRRRFELIGSYLAGRVFPTPQRKAESRTVENRIQNLIAESIRSEAEYESALEKIRVYVPLSGVSPEIDVPWLTGARALDRDEWSARALASNPDLRVQRLAVEEAAVGKDLAGREGLPETAVEASYERATAGQTERNYGLGLSLAFPSWNGNRSGVRSAERRRLAEERELAFEEQRLKAETARALVEYEAARQVVLKYPQETLARLEGQLDDADAGFRKGQVDLLTFLELDGSASETYARALDAQAELSARAAELLSLTADADALARLQTL